MAEQMAEQIIVPLDVASLGEAIAWVERLPRVRFWKVGLELFVSTGPDILAELKSRGKRIFLDLKFHDIPNTMAGACRAAATYGVDLVTVHAPAGPMALGAAQAAAIAAAQEVGLPPPCLLAVTVLTSLSAASLREDVQVAMPLEDYVPHLARLAQNSGIGGVVCSPQEITAIRRACGPDLVIVTPGIRPDWATSGDQQRTLTPAEAIAAGANYLVIGRPITQAPDPVAAFERICASVPASVPTRVPTRVPTSAPAD